MNGSNHVWTVNITDAVQVELYAQEPGRDASETVWRVAITNGSAVVDIFELDCDPDGYLLRTCIEASLRNYFGDAVALHGREVVADKF